MSAIDHARDYLLAVDPAGGILGFAQLLNAAIAFGFGNDPTSSEEDRTRFEAALPQIQQEVTKWASLDPVAQDVLMSVCYLKASEQVKGLAPRALTNISIALRNLTPGLGVLGALEPDFYAQVVIQAQRRSAADPAFHERLERAVGEVARLQDHLFQGCSDLTRLLPGQGVDPPAPLQIDEAKRALFVMVLVFVSVIAFGGAGQKG